MIGAKGVKGLLTSAALLAMLAGCLDTAAQPEPRVTPAVTDVTPTPDATVAAPTAPATATAAATYPDLPPLQPLPPVEFERLADGMARQLDSDVVVEEAALEGPAGWTGTGSRATATGTALDFAEFWTEVENLGQMLRAGGWQEDPRYMADSPISSAKGFYKAENMCLVSAGWKPTPEADCPADQPIALCDVPPEQQLYTIKLECARNPETGAEGTEGVDADVNDNPAPEPTDTPAHVPVGPAPAPGAGWMGYVNSEYGYQLWVPQDATIQAYGVQGFPTDELPEGMTVDVYLAQLATKYPDGLCLEIQYSLGYVYISAAANPQFRYATCGRTGAGGGEMRPKTDEIIIAGEVYVAHGFENITTTDFSSGLQGHNESMVLSLADGTRIEYGARPDRSATYEDYLAGTRPVLLQIVSSYRALAAP